MDIIYKCAYCNAEFSDMEECKKHIRTERLNNDCRYIVNIIRRLSTTSEIPTHEYINLITKELNKMSVTAEVEPSVSPTLSKGNNFSLNANCSDRKKANTAGKNVNSSILDDLLFNNFNI